MIGAIAGDIIGSVYEGRPIKTKTFPLFSPRAVFTDDTVLTVAVAVADAILSGTPYIESIRRIGRQYPHAGYGGSFFRWLHAENPRPCNSWGNSAAMRVSPVGFAFSTEAAVLQQARLTAEITHNHPEGIIAFLDSSSYEDAVRNAVSLGGDSDTQACIAGAIAEAFYGGVPLEIRNTVKTILTPDLWAVTEAFCER